MKQSFLSDIVAAVGRRLGLVSDALDHAAPSPQQVQKGMAAIVRLKRLQDEWRADGVTLRHVRSWASEGRK